MDNAETAYSDLARGNVNSITNLRLRLQCFLCALAGLITGVVAPAQTRIYETNVYVETIAGSGFTGYLDGQGASTMFYEPSSLVVDQNTNIFAWDRGNRRLRKITPERTVSTFAGTGIQDCLYQDQDRHGTNASFCNITDMVLDNSGNILVADISLIRKITPQGDVTKLAGSRESGYLNGDIASARFGQIFGVAVDQSGNIFVADTIFNRIRKIGTNGIVSTFAGSGNDGQQDGQGIFTSFSSPRSLAIDPAGNLFVADAHQTRIRRISPDAIVTTLAGRLTDGYQGGYGDGQGTNAWFRYISGLTADLLGNIFVSDNNLVRRVTPEGRVTTLAGGDGAQFGDGEGPVARFYGPSGLAIDTRGKIYVADTFNNRIRSVSFGVVPTTGFDLQLYAGLSVTGPIGRSYRIEYRNSLNDTNPWATAAEIRLTTSPLLWFDANSPNAAKRFYRAVLLP